MDRIINYLPDNVHVSFGWEDEPAYYNGPSNIKYSTIVIPKIWLKHNERGRYNEWEIKKIYRKKLAKEFGENYLHYTESLHVLEWDILENVALMIKESQKINFDDMLDIVRNVKSEDAKYLNHIR